MVEVTEEIGARMNFSELNAEQKPGTDDNLVSPLNSTRTGVKCVTRVQSGNHDSVTSVYASGKAEFIEGSNPSLPTIYKSTVFNRRFPLVLGWEGLGDSG